MRNEVGKQWRFCHWIIYVSGEKNERRVGFILDQDMKKCVLGYYQVPERTLVVKLKGKSFKIYSIVVYVLTPQSTEENSFTVPQCQGSMQIAIIMGDLNAKVNKEREK